MERRNATRVAVLAGTAAAGTALGWAARRRAAVGPAHVRDPEWAELHRPLGANELKITSFDGTVLHAEALGPPDAPVLILAHGYVMSLHSWHYQQRDLSDAFRVVAYDQRGHGCSEVAAQGDYSIEALGRDLAAVIAAVLPPGQKAFVAGHSMGGMSILSYAEQSSRLMAQQVAGVALVDTTAADVVRGSTFSAGSAKVAAVLGVAAARAVGLRPPGRAHYSDLSMFLTRHIGLSADAAAAHVAFTQELALTCPREVSATLMPALTALNVRGAARALRVPTLIVVGGEDRLTPPGASQELARLLPQAELLVLPGIGHMAPLEAHAEVSAHLRSFATACLRPAAA